MDPSTTNQLISGIGEILVVALVVLAVGSVCLSFAVFGIKSRLERIHFSLERTNRLLEGIDRLLDPATHEHLLRLRDELADCIARHVKSAPRQ